MQQTISIKLTDKSKEAIIRKRLEDLGWAEELSANEYVVWRMVGQQGHAMMYSSGKLVLQGEGVDEISKEFKNEQENAFEPHIGSDEVGKGDYFGPLVVVSAYVSDSDYKLLTELGVADSKSLSDSRILDIGENLSKILQYKEIVVSPSSYNDLIEQIGNVSILLAQKHAEAVRDLFARVKRSGGECEFVVFDQFSKNKGRLEHAMSDLPQLKVVQFHKGESDIAVAAASVLARYHFLKFWQEMELKYSFAFPKGASEVLDSGKEFIQKFGQQELKNVAKVSFKTTKKILTLF